MSKDRLLIVATIVALVLSSSLLSVSSAGSGDETTLNPEIISNNSSPPSGKYLNVSDFHFYEYDASAQMLSQAREMKLPIALLESSDENADGLGSHDRNIDDPRAPERCRVDATDDKTFCDRDKELVIDEPGSEGAVDPQDEELQFDDKLCDFGPDRYDWCIAHGHDSDDGQAFACKWGRTYWWQPPGIDEKMDEEDEQDDALWNASETHGRCISVVVNQTDHDSPRIKLQWRTAVRLTSQTASDFDGSWTTRVSEHQDSEWLLADGSRTPILPLDQSGDDVDPYPEECIVESGADVANCVWAPSLMIDMQREAEDQLCDSSGCPGGGIDGFEVHAELYHDPDDFDGSPGDSDPGSQVAQVIARCGDCLHDLGSSAS